MKRLLALIGLALIPALASADTVDLGPNGSLEIAVPKGWKLTSTKAQDTGYALMLVPPAGVNAQGLLNVVFVPKEEHTSKEDVNEKVLAACDQFVDQSVEKKKVLRELSLSGGAYGAYCVFTDASLVGQPPAKDNFKVVAIGMIRFNDAVSASASLLCDDEKGEDFAALLAAVTSAKVTSK